MTQKQAEIKKYRPDIFQDQADIIQFQHRFLFNFDQTENKT